MATYLYNLISLLQQRWFALLLGWVLISCSKLHTSLKVFSVLVTVCVFFTSSGLSGGAIAGIAIAVVFGILVFAGCLYLRRRRKKNMQKVQLLSTSEGQFH